MKKIELIKAVLDTLGDKYLIDNVLGYLEEEMQETGEVFPKNKQKHVGVEIEFDSLHSMLELIVELGKVKSLKGKYQIKTDCSVNSQYHYDGFEIALVDTEKGISNSLKCLLKVLKKMKCTVDETCGIHVHLDCRTRDRNKVFNNLLKAQKLLYLIADPNRALGQYSKYQSIVNPVQKSAHSYGIELSNFDTVEVRIMQGSLDYNYITNWINLLVNISNKKSNIKNTEHEEVVKELKLNTNLNRYIKKNVTKKKIHLLKDVLWAS